VKWKIWGRQQGKSYDIMQWWLEAPEKRFILCGSASLARVRQDDAKREYDDLVQKGWWTLGRPEAMKLIRSRILSVSQWQARPAPGYVNPDWKFAVDDADLTISQLVGGNVEIVGGCGQNDTPAPEQMAKLEAFYERYPEERQYYA
jgi:hypothetical protein